MKHLIESYRGRNYWGLLTWQLNDVWPTGGFDYRPLIAHARRVPKQGLLPVQMGFP